ncbi:EXS family-domain-containing protein [Scheffersomyces amazonensis]|uniref:EXS family-domain-containing protein n=1 Tax=Scheffersomyces amazonensis TaxID=1078765 RepID=UPI00315D1C74
MDQQPVLVTEIDTPTHELLFDDLIPLPFKILFIIQFGTFLWFSLSYILYNYTNLNLLRLLDLSYNPHNYAQLDSRDHGESGFESGEFRSTIPPSINENNLLITGIWNNLKAITIVNVLSWTLFKIVQTNYEHTAEHTDNPFATVFAPLYYILPIIAFSYLFYRLFYKSTSRNNAVNHKGQFRVYTTMKRILLGFINSTTMRTNDILISDSLTSYSKICNDFGLFFWNYYYSDDIAYDIHLEFIILCIPTFIRIRQCYLEYTITRKNQHILNLLKYASALGPLLVNLSIKYNLTLKPFEADEMVQQILMKKIEFLNNWWYIFSFINSTYSFIWDVKMDWNFELFDSLINPNKKFRVLRNKLAFKTTAVYFVIIILDFILRFVWVLKLFIITEELDNSTYLHVFSTFLFGYDAFSFGYTVLETLEIIRRWLWCFIKLESDWVKLEPGDYDIELTPTSANKRDT